MRHLFFAATLAAALPFPGLPSQFEKIAPAAKGRVGVAAQLLESGETADLHGDEHFPMHSVYKLPISMAVLQRVDRGELKLDQLVKVEPSDFVRTGMYSPVRDKYPNGTELTIAELLRYTICESDGSTSDVLMKLIGGPGSVMAFLEEIQVPDIQVVNSEKEIGRDWETQYRNWATPKAALALLVALQSQRGLSRGEPGSAAEVDDRSHPGRETPQRRIACWNRSRTQDRHRRHSQRHHLCDQRHRHYHSARWPTPGRGRIRLRFRRQ